MGKVEISEYFCDFIISIMKKVTMELIRKEVRKRLNESIKITKCNLEKGRYLVRNRIC